MTRIDKLNPAWDYVGNILKARRAIKDSPLASDDASCKRGDLGECVDFDELSNLLYVDFGKGAIAAYPFEVTSVINKRR